MSRRANPVTIGIFVSGAFALLAALVIFFGSSQFFEKKEQFILFFDESVNGLNVGSAVKFKGVPIGRVTRILIRAENQSLDSSAIPVIVELDQARLRSDLASSGELFDESQFARQISRGLRARLNSESFITGLLFIELDYVENAPEPRFVQETMVYREIPTIPSTVQAITQRAMEAIAALSEVDIAETLKTVQETIRLTRLRLEQFDVPRLVDTYAEAGELLKTQLETIDLPATMEKLDHALDQIGDLANTLQGESVEISDGVLDALTLATDTFTKIKVTLDEVNTTLGSDSRLLYEVETMLQSVSRTSDALRSLADFIERNPNAFLRGRPRGESP